MSATKSKKNVNTNKQTKDYKGQKKIHPLWLLLLLVFVVTFIYHKVFGFPFVAFDDNAKVFENPLITKLSLSNIRLFFTSFVFHTYMPLTLLSYAIDYSLWQLTPSGYHSVNILIHIINTALLFVFIKKFSGNQAAAFYSALLFAVHPMNVESVAWVSERSNLLYTVFFILALWGYHSYNLTKKTTVLLLTYLFFVLSLLSKPGAVLIPVVFVLMDIYKKYDFTAKKILLLSTFFIVSFLTGIVAIYASKATGNLKDFSLIFSVFDRIAIASYSMSVYFIKFFIPFKLSAFYPFPSKTGNMLPSVYYISFLLPLIVAYMVFKSKKYRHLFLFGLLFFLSNISIVLMLVPVGGNFMIAEHFVYVPYIGFCFIAGIWISNQLSNDSLLQKKNKSYIAASFAIVIIVFSGQSYVRTNVWKNSSFLFTDMIEKNPEHALGYHGLGVFNYMQGDLKSALENQNAAILADSTYEDAWYYRGIIYKDLQKFDLSLSDLSKTIALSPMSYRAYCDRGNVYLKLQDTLKAINDYNKSISISPTYSDAFYNRGRLRSAQKEYQAAIDDFTKAIQLNKFDADAYNNRAIAKYFLKSLDSSILDYNEAIKINPKNGLFYKNRGLSYLSMNDTTKACDDFYQAYSLGFKEAATQLKKYCY